MEENRRLQLASVSKPCMPTHWMHRNQLQDYAQRLDIQFLVYHSINEGFPHAPKFSASVVVSGEEYDSTQTFPHKKDVEQDVAKIALESIFKRIKNEAHSFIFEVTLIRTQIIKSKIKLYCGKNVKFVRNLDSNPGNPSGKRKGTNIALASDKAPYFQVEKSKQELFSELGFGRSGENTLLLQIIKSNIKLYHGKNVKVVGNLDNNPENPSRKRKGTDIALASDKAPYFQVKKSKELFSEVGFGRSGENDRDETRNTNQRKINTNEK